MCSTRLWLRRMEDVRRHVWCKWPNSHERVLRYMLIAFTEDLLQENLSKSAFRFFVNGATLDIFKLFDRSRSEILDFWRGVKSPLELTELRSVLHQRGINNRIKSDEGVIELYLLCSFAKKFDHPETSKEITEEEFLAWDRETVTASEDILEDLQKEVTSLFGEWDKFMNHKLYTGSHSNGSCHDTSHYLFRKVKALYEDVPLRLKPAFELYRYNGCETPKSYKGSTPFHKIIQVPKSWKTKRLISMESASMMFCQKGLQNLMYDYFEYNHAIRRAVNLRDKTVSMELARQASMTKDSATIDLSHASDSVSLALVRRLFRRTPIINQLLRYRSPIAIWDGKPIVIEKYGPMGSALTFPVETIVFLCVARLARRYSRIYAPSSANHHLQVYGDDCIVPEYCVETFLSLLVQLGFEPNVEKSYFGSSRFREACGMEALDGRDITPLFLPRKIGGTLSRQGKIKSDGLHTWCDLQKSSFLNTHSQRFAAAISNLINFSGYKMYYSSTAEEYGQLYSTEATNYHLDVAHNSDLQASFYLTDDVVGVFTELPTEGDSAPLMLHEWLRTRGEQSSFDKLPHRLKSLAYGKDDPRSFRLVKNSSRFYADCDAIQVD